MGTEGACFLRDDRLAKVGLIRQRESAYLAGYINAYIAGRIDLKPITVEHVSSAVDKVVTCIQRRINGGCCFVGALRAIRSVDKAGDSLEVYDVRTRLIQRE